MKQQLREFKIEQLGIQEFQNSLREELARADNETLQRWILNRLTTLYWAYEVIKWRKFEVEKPNFIPLGIPLFNSVFSDFKGLLERLELAQQHPSPRINPRGVWEQGFMTCLLKSYLVDDGYVFLDVGCGKGFLAGLCQRFYPESSYIGFDILDAEIDFARTEFPQPQYTFKRIKGGHTVYKPNDSHESDNFPVNDNSIDVVFGLSIWTHLPPSVSKRYLGEVARVLKPEGFFVATFLLLDGLDKQSATTYNFDTPFNEDKGFHFQNSSNPIIAKRRDPVAVEKLYLTKLLSNLGLEIMKIFPGCWNNKSRFGACPQDCLVAKKLE